MCVRVWTAYADRLSALQRPIVSGRYEAGIIGIIIFIIIMHHIHTLYSIFVDAVKSDSSRASGSKCIHNNDMHWYAYVYKMLF